ncbi:hypothetical protein FHT09_003395 [Xanthomonas arboricola]|uniref:hypothetical protein n=1 Tax=Xanthomonas arboricola TaxID=56448 RepID=UPI001856E97C|nr:hypothetical protein [Xanthomonas sp. CFBP 8152]
MPVLQQTNPQHPPVHTAIDQGVLTTDSALDQPKQLLQWNDLIHLGQEVLAAGLLALAQALSVTERQLHGSFLNVCGLVLPDYCALFRSSIDA